VSSPVPGTSGAGMRSGPRVANAAGGERCPGLSWQRAFPGEAGQVAAVRRRVTSLLPGCPSRGDLVLVASELAGNAIPHTASGQGGTFAVQVTRGGDAVAAAADDAGGPGEPQVVDDPLAEGGRGLLAARELPARMSVSGTGAGRQASVGIPWHDPAAPVTGQAHLGSRFGGPAWHGSGTRPRRALRTPVLARPAQIKDPGS
jgi:serine/threonine-protein kinase RsbW